MTLTWHATELGWRTDDLRYRLKHTDRGWQLCDEDSWKPLAEPTRRRQDAQQIAERIERRRTDTERV
jgi:hypothetical protein